MRNDECRVSSDELQTPAWTQIALAVLAVVLAVVVVMTISMVAHSVISMTKLGDPMPMAPGGLHRP